jgi:hypothetical protein
MDIMYRDDMVARVVTAVGVALMGALAFTTVISGIYSSMWHPGDTVLDMIYVAVVYTSPYVIFSAVAVALFILKKSRAISITFLIGVVTLIGLWLFKNLMQVEEDVTFGFSLYETLGKNFKVSAYTAGAFAAVMLMQAYLTLSTDYGDFE